jgi:hypothetical protein
MARLQSLLKLSDAQVAKAIGIYAKDFRDIRRNKRKPTAAEYHLIDSYIREMAEEHDAEDSIFAPVEDYDVSGIVKTTFRIACGTAPGKS